MESDSHVVFIGSTHAKLYGWARDCGCEVVARGNSEANLAEAIGAMARSAGLVTLDGHGSGWRARYASSGPGGAGRAVDFEPTSIAASHVIMSVCYGRRDHYLEAIRASGSPVLDVVGPLEEIGGKSYRATVEHLIQRFREGVNPATALEEARELGKVAVNAEWGITSL